MEKGDVEKGDGGIFRKYRPHQFARKKDWINLSDPSDPPSMNAMAGSVVLLVFWDPNNGASVAQISRLNTLFEKYKDNDEFKMIAICTSKSGENMKSVAATRKMKYPAGVDIDGSTEAAYLVDGHDDYYLIGKNMKIRIPDCDNDSLEAAVEYLLGESLNRFEETAVRRRQSLPRKVQTGNTGGG